MWQEVIKNQLWTAEYLVPGFKSRTTVARLDNEKLLIISPGAAVLESFAENFSNLGKPAFLLLSNSFHHLGAPTWRKSYPDVQVVCAEGAAKRIASKGHAHVKPLVNLIPHLPSHMTLLEPAGTRMGETWVRIDHGGKNIWIVCDAFFNMPRLSSRLITRLIQKLLSAAPGLKISALVKYGLVKDRGTYKSWVMEQIEKDRPALLVPAHGDILSADDLPDKLKSLMLRRF